MAFERVSIQEAKEIILNRRRGENREDSILVGKYDGRAPCQDKENSLNMLKGQESNNCRNLKRDKRTYADILRDENRNNSFDDENSKFNEGHIERNRSASHEDLESVEEYISYDRKERVGLIVGKQAVLPTINLDFLLYNSLKNSRNKLDIKQVS